MSAGERQDSGSRDAPADARETRRRYPADEVSHRGRWMQHAGGVELFPEDAPAPKASGWLSAKREPRRGRKGPRETNMCAVSPAPEGATRGHGRGRSGAEPSKTSRVAQDCDPTAYMYTPSGRKDALIGRFSRASTVAPTVTARWKTSTLAHKHKATNFNQRNICHNFETQLKHNTGHGVFW